MMFKEVKLFYFVIKYKICTFTYKQINKYGASNLFKYYNTVTVDMFLHSSIYLTHKAYKQLIIIAATKTLRI